jgi:hypothetical protein
MNDHDERHDDYDDAREFHLDEQRLSALSVIDAATESGWFTDAELNAALDTTGSSLFPPFAAKLDRCLDNYRDEMKNRRWPLEANVLKRAFDDYLRRDINILARRSA